MGQLLASHPHRVMAAPRTEVALERRTGENSPTFCAFSAEQDKDRRWGVRTLLFKDFPSDSGGTFSLSFRGQAASGVDFVLADTEEHDYIQLTAL